MRIDWWSSGPTRGAWLGPAALGALLIALGLLLYAHPELLAYFVAGIFVLAGVGLLGVAWRLRPRITYRHVEETWRDDSPADETENR